jgi:phage antirepressor YoqD-like protein
MKATKEQFSEFIKTLGEVVGKNITDRMVKTYWDVLFKVDAEALKEAAQVLIAKGKWASINDWLDECGYATKKTRKERYDATAQEELIDVKTKSPMVESGEMTWMFEAETESETQADLLFSEKERQLKAQGWTVRGTTTNRARTRPEGKAPSKTIFVRFWDCIKVQPYNPSRRFNTPQEGMAAIKELLGPEMARKLIPCAESYEKGPTSVETVPAEQWEF